MSKKTAPVYLVDGLRTPYLTHSNSSHLASSADLITTLSRQVLIRQPFHAGNLDGIFVASSTPKPLENLASTLAERLQSMTMPYYFTNNGAMTGHVTLTEAIQKISCQQQQLILVAGVDTFALPNRPSTELNTVDSVGNLLKRIHSVQSLVEQISKEKHSADTDVTLIEHAEKFAVRHRITPDQMSEYAQLSRRRLQYAQRNNLLHAITPLYARDGSILKGDQGIGSSSTQNSGKDGLLLLSDDALPIHANAASCILLASESAVKQYDLPVLAQLMSPTFSTSPDSQLENTPNAATTELLQSLKLSMNDIDFWEYHESSATDLLVAKLHAQESTFSSMKNVNIDGGSLALGSAPCANVLREILQLAYILKRKQRVNGIATAVGSKQQSFALLLKATQEKNNE